MDTIYPQPIKLRLGSATRRKRGSPNRYRTQPVTFSEIKEVDEELTNEEEEVDSNRRMSVESGGVMNSKSSSDVNAKFEAIFARRTERRNIRKQQRKLDLCKKPTVSTIPSSPENGRKNYHDVSELSIGLHDVNPSAVFDHNTDANS